MKLCGKCNEQKEFSEFNKNARKADGLQNWCRVCCKISNNLSYRNSPTRKDSILERNKKEKELCRAIIRFYKSGGCLVCKESCVACIDLHHTDDNKEANVSALINHGLARVIKEMQKCVALCSNCHKKHHAGMLELNLSEYM